MVADSTRAPGKPERRGKKMSGAAALKAAQIKPLVLEAKEAISLINGTQAMLAVGALALLSAETLADSADVIGALSLDALKGTDAAFDERIHSARPHAGQSLVAANLRRMLEGSTLRESHKDCGRVQDAYSLRCMPQVHGAARAAFAYARQVLEVEANSATDNPLIFPDEGEGGLVVSGGNFHGQPVAQVLDVVALALADLASISERRIERLVNPDLSGDLPPFLTDDPGVSSGFMIAQITAAALASECKALSMPASVDSIPAGAGKEDHVSMGMTSAIKLRRVLRNVETVLGLELMIAAQGLEYRRPLRPGRGVERAYDVVRERHPPLTPDPNLAPDNEVAATLVREGVFAEIWRS
jgi:histidine ammonia-lyase